MSNIIPGSYEDEVRWERACRRAEEETLRLRNEYIVGLMSNPELLIQAIQDKLEMLDGYGNLALLIYSMAQTPQDHMIYGMDCTPTEYCQEFVRRLAEDEARDRVREVDPEQVLDQMIAADEEALAERRHCREDGWHGRESDD